MIEGFPSIFLRGHAFWRYIIKNALIGMELIKKRQTSPLCFYALELILALSNMIQTDT